jgi:hypothetical protein
MDREWAKFEAALERSGHAHEVDASLGQAGGREWIVLASAVAAASELDPWEALAHNATLAVGSLCTAEGMVLLKHVTPVDADQAAAALGILAEEAARLRDQVSAATRRRAVDLFANYGE